MDTRSLQLFLNLSETLHFGRTSRQCNISASALTRSIQRLEDQVGEPLFVRNRRQVALTQTGMQFRETAGRMLQEWRSFQSVIASHSGTLRGELSIYSSVTAVYTILPTVLQRFRYAYPDVQIKLETGDAADALAKIGEGTIDVVVAALPDELPGNLNFIPLRETPLVCIRPVDEQTSSVTMIADQIDWLQTPVIMAERGLSRQRLEAWFRHEGINPHTYAHVAGHEAIIAMVRLGCGVGVVPELVLEKSPFRDEVTIVPDGPKLAPYKVGICIAKGNCEVPVVKAFQKAVVQ